jgi:ATP-binding cassette subfamily B protein
MKSNNQNPVSTLLLPHIKQNGLILSLIFSLVVLVVGIDLAQPIIIKDAIDKYLNIAHPDAKTISLIALVYLVFTIAALILTYVQDILLQSTGQSIVKNIRTTLFRHIQHLPLRYFDQNPTGRIITNIVSDTEALNNFFSEFLPNTLRGLLTLVMIIIFMFQLDIVLAASCLAVVPIILLISKYFQDKLRVINQEMRTRLSSVIAFLAENLAGMTIIQIFGQENKQYRQFDNKNQRLLESAISENRTNLLFFLFTEAFSDIGVAALVWFGSGPVLQKTMSFGVLYAFIGYVRRFFQPINMITMQLNIFQSMLVASDRIVRTFTEKPDIIETGDTAPHPIRGKIEFKNVRFSYREDREVLKGISLLIKPGDRVGIVGASGAGKTSLMSLLTRSYDVTSGSISIDNSDIRKWPLETLRKTVGIVQQDIALFSGSVLDNIRFFRDDITPQKVYEVAEMTGADVFIKKLPSGYDTLLSEKGTTLSFGERQLLSFARVMALDPKILILDEATASLDSETELMLQDAIARVSEGRTLLAIAHRLSTVQQMDYIIVIDNGQIVETGDHEQLLSLNGYYTKLHKSGLLVEEVII